MSPQNGLVPTIQDYGVIGDCRSMALVSKYGSIDWLCWPRFDSSSIFSALLDPEKGGHWSIFPAQQCRPGQSYIRQTNVLQTRFACDGGQAILTDLMPVSSDEFKQRNILPDHELIREVQCTAGALDLEIKFQPRANYGRKPARIRDCGALGLQMIVGRGAYWLRSSIHLEVGEGGISASAPLKQGEVLQFSLTYTEESPATLPALGDRIHSAIDRSIAWWTEWAERCKYRGPYRETVIRSALALKLLSYAPSGAVAAAATSSLPEIIGGSLNWDYRYCWLRDSSLTVRALLGLGYFDEADSFLTWLLHSTRLTQPELCVLYTVFGQSTGRERELPELTGYRGSRPVRIGNGARNQLQLDIYGEVVEATAQYAQYLQRFDRMTQKVMIGFGKYIAHNWDQPDEGIWEPRSGRANHTHSRLMCWVALDRLLALSEKKALNGVPVELFTRERDRIRQQIETRAWNENLQSYASTLDGDGLDATLLRLPWYGFEHADSHRMKQTYKAIRETLGAGGPLLYRYQREPPEGAFGICGFWAVEHLALGGGMLEEAHAMFRQLLQYQNELGLFSEEIDPQSGDALGNFPQAFTHIGLISAALTLEEQEKGKAHPAVKVGSDVKSSPQRAQA